MIHWRRPPYDYQFRDCPVFDRYFSPNDCGYSWPCWPYGDNSVRFALTTEIGCVIVDYEGWYIEVTL